MFPMLEEIVHGQRLDREREVAAAQTGARSASRRWDWSERLQAIRRLISSRIVFVREVP
jgi:hypothetical protein